MGSLLFTLQVNTTIFLFGFFIPPLGVMVRLLLVLAPAISILGGIGVSFMIDFFCRNFSTDFYEDRKKQNWSNQDKKSLNKKNKNNFPVS